MAYKDNSYQKLAGIAGSTVPPATGAPSAA
jgi:hypothetical protein